jgi:hypothetical protein
MRLSPELKAAIAFAKLELLEIEAGKRELTRCPGVKNVADAIRKAERAKQKSPPPTSEELKRRAERLGLKLYARSDGSYLIDFPLDLPPLVEACPDAVSANDHLNGFEDAGRFEEEDTL